MSKASELYLYEWPEPFAWVNTSTPFPLALARGRVTLIWFWNAHCVHSRQELSELKLLETRFTDGLVIVGVHEPRYQADTNAARVLKHVNRLHIRFPVLLDPQMHLARQLAITAWPSAVLLDVEGRVVGIYPGAGRRGELESKIDALLEEAAGRDARSFEPMPQARQPEPNSPLSFPVGIAFAEQYLYLSDSARNRVLELTYEGRIHRCFGSGNAGLFDGRLSESGFNGPTGLALGRDQLFIADTGNHALRRVRLTTGEVDTVAGTGRLSTGFLENGLARATALASPLGLAYHQDRVYIAMAGLHQIWLYDLATLSLQVIAGNGREEPVDGFSEFASFGQPTGLSAGRDALFIADAGTNGVRTLRFVDGAVGTAIDGQAFQEGDADGPVSAARLAGPRALAADPARGVVWISDTINNKLKIYSPGKSEVKTLKLNYQLAEPSGIAVRGNELWIVNTNAHELLRLDLKTGKLARIAIT